MIFNPPRLGSKYKKFLGKKFCIKAEIEERGKGSDLVLSRKQSLYELCQCMVTTFRTHKKF